MKAILFDFDGTLADSMTMWREIGSSYLKQNNIDLVDEDAQKMSTMSLKMSSKFIKDRFKFSKSEEEIYKDFLDKVLFYYKNECKLKTGASEILEKIKQKGYRMAIVSGGEKEIIQEFLSKHNLLDYFEFIQTCDEVNIKKNQEEFFLEAIKNINLNPQDIYLIDDSILALKAAKKCGIKTICLLDDTSVHLREELKSQNDYLVESLGAIPI